MPAQPQDHKTAKSGPFRFTDALGKTHTLPSVDKGRSAMSGRDLRDGALGGDTGMLAYMLKVLEASQPAPKALDALYDLPQQDMIDVLKDWAEYGDGDGASLGE